jgi:hypothetical protein
LFVWLLALFVFFIVCLLCLFLCLIALIVCLLACLFVYLFVVIHYSSQESLPIIVDLSEVKTGKRGAGLPKFLYDPTLVTNVEAPQVSGVAEEAEVGVAGDGAAGTTDAADAGPAAVAAAASSDSAKTPKTDAADAEIADDDTHVTHVFKLPLVGPISFLRGNGCSYKMTTFHGIDVFVSADKAAFGSDCPVVGWQLPISEEPTLEIEWMTDKWDLPTYLHMNGVASVDVTIPCLVLPDKFRTVSDVVELTRPALPDETNKKQQQRSKLEVAHAPRM